MFEVQCNEKSNLDQLCDPCSYLQIKCYPGLIFRWYYKLVSAMRNSNPEKTDNTEIIVTRVCKIILVGVSHTNTWNHSSVSVSRNWTQTRYIAKYKVKSVDKLKLE